MDGHEGAAAMLGAEQDDLILSAIRHAATAGGCAIWAKRDERCAAGLGRVADRYSEAATSDLNEWATKAGLQASFRADEFSGLPDLISFPRGRQLPGRA